MIEVVGMGDDGWAGLAPAARAIVEKADGLIGGERHLELLPDSVAPGARRSNWPSPLRPNLRPLIESFAGDVVVLASGDPLRSGIASTLIAEFGSSAVRVHPGVSSDTLARARMGWSAETTDVVTLVGRDPHRLRPFIAPGVRLVVLCSDGSGPGKVAEILVRAGAGDAQLTAWWHLGGIDEGSRSAQADEWGQDSTPDLVVVCVEVPRVMSGAEQAGPAAGRPDSLFEHDGLITKRDVRASALARLRPTPGAVLWDLGAGSGAVGLEWALAAPNACVVSVEQDPARADRIEQNAAAWGLSSRVQIQRTSTQAAVEDGSLPEPDAIFLGGGLSAEVIAAAYDRLVTGGRLVAHAVTLESEQLVRDAISRFGGEAVRISLEHLEPLGRFTSWRPARAVVSWSVTKPAAVPQTRTTDTGTASKNVGDEQ